MADFPISNSLNRWDGETKASSDRGQGNDSARETALGSQLMDDYRTRVAGLRRDSSASSQDQQGSSDSPQPWALRRGSSTKGKKSKRSSRRSDKPPEDTLSLSDSVSCDPDQGLRSEPKASQSHASGSLDGDGSRDEGYDSDAAKLQRIRHERAGRHAERELELLREDNERLRQQVAELMIALQERDRTARAHLDTQMRATESAVQESREELLRREQQAMQLLTELASSREKAADAIERVQDLQADNDRLHLINQGLQQQCQQSQLKASSLRGQAASPILDEHANSWPGDGINISTQVRHSTPGSSRAGGVDTVQGSQRSNGSPPVGAGAEVRRDRRHDGLQGLLESTGLQTVIIAFATAAVTSLIVSKLR